MAQTIFKKKAFSEIFAETSLDYPKTATYGEIEIRIAPNINGDAYVYISHKVSKKILGYVLIEDDLNLKGGLRVNGSNICGVLHSTIRSLIENNADYVRRDLPINIYIFSNFTGIDDAMEELCKFLQIIQGL